MKYFITFIKKIKGSPRCKTVGWVLVFYGMMMIVYIYLMNANLSTAPVYVYSQF